jgi:hypothetical protein
VLQYRGAGAGAAMPPRPSGRATLDAHVDVIKQHPGPVTAQRRVKVDVPGKFFPQLEASERALNYEGEAVEFQERRDFKQHVAWGAAHKGPGIRFVCTSDAIDDPDNKGFWTTLALFNRWRHETYKDRRNDELQYLDAVPAAPAGNQAAAPSPTEKTPPEIKQHFVLTSNHNSHLRHAMK